MVNRLTAIIALIGSTIWASDPAQAVTQALEWSKANPAANVRFLSLGNVPEEERPQKINTLLFTINGLNLGNRSVELIHCSPDLVGVNLYSVGWDYQAWESLGQRNAYFRGPWLESSDDFTALRAATGSAYPLVRADEFVAKASVAPAYYDFLFGSGKVKTRAELHAVLGITDQFKGLKIAGVKAFGLSVTTHGRILEYRPGPFPLWTSNDADSDTGRSNVLRNLDLTDGGQDDLQIAGQEHVFRLRNGLMGAYLNDAKGNRVDEVPITIARGEVNFPDRRVRAGRSCWTCHEQGVKSFTSDEHGLLKQSVLQLSTIDEKTKLLFENKFDPQSIQDAIEDGQSSFERSVFRLTSDDCQSVAQGFKSDWIGYEEAKVGLSAAVTECGIPEQELIPVLASMNDPNALALIPQGNVQFEIPRTVWEEIYPLVMYAKRFPNQVVYSPKTAQIKLESAAETYSSDRMDQVEVGKPDANWNYTVTLKPDADGVYPGWVEFKLKGGKTVRHEVLK